MASTASSTTCRPRCAGPPDRGRPDEGHHWVTFMRDRLNDQNVIDRLSTAPARDGIGPDPSPATDMIVEEVGGRRRVLVVGRPWEGLLGPLGARGGRVVAV